MTRTNNLVARRDALRELFREYLVCKRSFLAAAEAWCIKGWPDRKPAILQAYEIQVLFNERESRRLEHWIAFAEDAADGSWDSLDGVEKRLTDGWRDGEETALATREPRYREIVAEIAAAQASLDKDALKEPFDAARRDPEYATALAAIQQKLAELDRKLIERT